MADEVKPVVEAPKPDPKAVVTDTTATPIPTDTTTANSAATGSPAKPTVEQTIERALAAERKANEAKKAADALQSKFGKHTSVMEMIDKADVDDATLILEVLKARGRAADDKILFELAKKFPETVEPTEEEKRQAEIDAAIEKRETAKADKAKAEADAKAAETLEQGKKELTTHLEHVATVLSANMDSLIGLKATGTSENRYKALLVEAIDKGEDPKSDGFALKILQKMNDEAVVKLKAAGLMKDELPKTEADKPAAELDPLAAHAAKAFNLHKPKNFKPEQQDKTDEVAEAKKRLRAYDQEKKAAKERRA